MGACTVCGRTMDKDAQFCSGCGRLLAPGTTHRVVSYPERLVRPREDRMIAGVCAAFALRYGWDLALVRLAVVLVLLFGCGLPLLIYFAAWIAIPNAQYALPAQAGPGPGSMAV